MKYRKERNKRVILRKGSKNLGECIVKDKRGE
jgi:hypothetical protein